MRKLENRVAIITGAGGGIGAATARILAQSGAKVVVTDVIPQREQVAASINSQGATALPLEVDVTDTTQVRQAVPTELQNIINC